MDEGCGYRGSRRGGRHGHGHEQQQWPPTGGSDAEEADVEDEEEDEEEVELLMSTFDRCRPRADGTVDARCVALGARTRLCRKQALRSWPWWGAIGPLMRIQILTRTVRSSTGSDWRWAPPTSSSASKKTGAARRATRGGTALDSIMGQQYHHWMQGKEQSMSQ